MSDERFSPEQAQYLASLPAVISITGSRIRYAEWCKRECVSSAENGESPTVLFREAGLGPGTVDRVNLPDSEVTSSRTNEGNPETGGNDMRDLIIRRQALYIRRLELKVDGLKMQLSQQSLSNDVQ